MAARDTVDCCRPNGSNAAVGSFLLNGRRFLVYPSDHDRYDDGLVTLVGTLLLDGQCCRIVEQIEPAVDITYNPAQVLTRRELQVAALVAHGQCAKRIAYDLRISEWTVQTHLRRIYAKLGVAGRAEMVFRCARLLSTED